MRFFRGRSFIRYRSPHAVLLLAAIFLGLLWLTAWQRIEHERRTAVSAGLETSKTWATRFALETGRVLREAEATGFAISWIARHHGLSEAAQFLALETIAPALGKEAFIANAQGNVVFSTLPLATAVNVSERESFRVHRSGTNPDFHIGRPARSLVSQNWVVVTTTRISGPKNEFRGIVALTVSPSSWTNGFAGEELGRNALLSIIGTDGVVRVRDLAGQISYGEQLEPARMLGILKRLNGAPEEVTVAADNIRRFVANVSADPYPIVVVVGVDRREALARFERWRATYIWQAALGSVTAMVLAATLALHLARLRRARDRAERLSLYDSLTALPNRAHFYARLSEAISRAKRQQGAFALLYLDLDGFKSINDTYGHAAGDKMLIAAAKRLQDAIRESDMASRLAGDEFAVVAERIEVPAGVERLCGRIQRELSRPASIGAAEICCGASVGVAVYPQDGRTAHELLHSADSAMYRVKKQRKNIQGATWSATSSRQL